MPEVFYKGTQVGILIRTIRKGSVAVTNGGEPLQLVTLKHPKGSDIAAHTHAPRKRTVQKLQECLIVRKGRVRLDLYAPDGTLFTRVTLKAGDSFILQNGGYGIHLLEDSELLEVKNGPFLDDKVLL